jgi:hypothetical protein
VIFLWRRKIFTTFLDTERTGVSFWDLVLYILFFFVVRKEWDCGKQKGGERERERERVSIPTLLYSHIDTPRYWTTGLNKCNEYS